MVATACTVIEAEAVAALKVGDVSRNGTVSVAETTGASTSEALKQAGAITALGSYDRSRYLNGEGRTATGLDTGTGLTVIAGALTSYPQH